MRTYLRLLRFVTPYWKHVALSMACMLVFGVFSGFSLGMILPFVNILFGTSAFQDAMVTPAAEGIESSPEISVPGALPGDDLREELKARLMDFFVADTPMDSLVRVCVAIAIIFLVKGVFGYLQAVLMAVVEQGVIRDVRNSLYEHLNRLSLRFFTDEPSGRVISRITNDVTLVRAAVSAIFKDVMRDAFLLLVYLGLALWASWQLTLLALLVFPPVTYLIARISVVLRKQSTRSQEQMAVLTSLLQETISGIRVVKAFAMERFEIKRFKQATQGYFKAMVRLQRVAFLAPPLTEYLGAIAALVVLWVGGRQILITGSLSPDWFLIFLAAMLGTMQPAKKMSNANASIQEGVAAAKRVFQLLDTPPLVSDRPWAAEIRAFKEAISFNQVSFAYDGSATVLDDICTKISAGEVVAVVGPSGAGKSTFADLVPRFYDPTGGSLTIDGADLRDLTLRSLRQLMGIVTQETILFNDTIRSNIAYGEKDIPLEQILEAARAANALEFIEPLPERFETMIGERGVKLSGGERQRLAIARAILKNPPILIFDEATSSLDSESEAKVQGAIERLMEGRTVIIIAHRLSTVQRADRILVMDQGRIVQEGTHTELVKQDGLYRRLYEMQAGGILGEGRLIPGSG